MDSPLARLRLRLAEAKAVLRNAQDDYKLAKAHAEQVTSIDGKNEAERMRKLTIALAEDVYHSRALQALRQAEYEVDRVEAAIESLLDDRRAWEWSIRSALIDALGQAGKDDGAAFDGMLDHAGLLRCETLSRAPIAADAASDINDLFS